MRSDIKNPSELLKLTERMYDMLTDIECLGYLIPAPEDTKAHKLLVKDYYALKKDYKNYITEPPE